MTFLDSTRGLVIGILGPLTVKCDGLEKTLPRSRKTRALLAYLILQARPVRRDELCDLLWQGAPDPKGELRWCLAKIRTIVGSYLETTHTYAFIPPHSTRCDGAAFLELADNASADEDVERALRLWRGVPLSDAEVAVQQAFQSWLALTRDRFLAKRTSMLRAAVDRHWQTPDAALRAARRLVVAEPWCEWGHGRVTQLLMRCGRSQESASYREAARRSLSLELGVPETSLTLSPPVPSGNSDVSQSSLFPEIVDTLRVRIEHLQQIPRSREQCAVASAIQSALATALVAKKDLHVVEGRTLAVAAPACGYADFAVRGVIARIDNRYVVSLRCVSLPRSWIVWATQTELVGNHLAPLNTWLADVVGDLSAKLKHFVDDRLGDFKYRQRLHSAAALANALEPSANKQAIALLNAMLSEEPYRPDALALSAWCHAQRAVYNWSLAADLDRTEARHLAMNAMEHPGFDHPECLTTLAAARMLIGDMSAAEILLDRALHQESSAPNVLIRAGWLSNYLHEPRLAIGRFQSVVRQAPLEPSFFNALAGQGAAYFMLGDYQKAIWRMEQALTLNPRATWVLRNLIPAYWAARNYRQAELGVQRLQANFPGLSVTEAVDAMVFPKEVLAKIGRGLLDAGLPP